MIEVQDPMGRITTTSYDAEGRVLQVVAPRGEVTRVRDPAIAALAATTGDWQLGYDALGRPVRERGPFGVERRTAYTVEGFVASVELHSSTALVEAYAYSGHDALGNPGQIDRNGTVTAIQYDPRSRVEKVAYPGGSLAACLTSCERFAYDLAGNRVTHAENGLETTYVVDADDRLIEILDASAQTVATFTHDAAGRRTSRTDAGAPTHTYAYDALGRLRHIQESGFHSTLAYTATDERTTRTDVLGITRYLGEWYETTPSTSRRLVHGPGIDNVLGQVGSNDQLTFLLRDGTANVVYTAQDGTFANNSRKYEAFGGVRGGPLAVERGFAGRPTEGLTSLINVRARHYDAETGRFLQPDPLGVGADQLYAYAAGNPYRFWDPAGSAPAPINTAHVAEGRLGDSEGSMAGVGGSPREIASAIALGYGVLGSIAAGAAIATDAPTLHGATLGLSLVNVATAMLQFAHRETPGDVASAALFGGLAAAGLFSAVPAGAVFGLTVGLLAVDTLAEGGVAGVADRAISSFLDPLYGNNINFYYENPEALRWYNETYR